jgi:hypothetical protein
VKHGIVVSLAEGPEACVEKVARLDLPTCRVRMEKSIGT